MSQLFKDASLAWAETARRVRRGMAAAVLCLGLTGCAEAMQQAESMSRSEDSQRLAVGMTEAQVIELLGKPPKRERWGNTQFLLFETNYFSLDSSGRYTPVALVDGKVVSWDQAYYENTVRARKHWNTETQSR